MAGGMFRGGHMRPTFDTAVEFIPINQVASDRSGGYGSPSVGYGDWGDAVAMSEKDIEIGNYLPPDDQDMGVIATVQYGILAWYTDGNTKTLFHQARRQPFASVRVRTNNVWGAWQAFTNNVPPQYLASNANRNRSPLPHAQFIAVNTDASENAALNMPPISLNAFRYAILVDQPSDQSLYICNDTRNRCEHYRRLYDGGKPIRRTYYADVKDIAGTERVLGDQTVATRTKSLVFAHATLKPLLDAEGSIAKDWKVRIDGRDMDITGVMDGWVPNRYTRLTVEDRS